MSRIQLKLWRAPLATLAASLAEGEVAIASETNTLYKRPDGSATGALIPVGGSGGAGVRAKVAAPSNVATLSGLLTIDGVALAAGDIVLLPKQTAPAQNGVYLVASGAWTRLAGMDQWSNLVSAMVIVEKGGSLADSVWICTADNGGTLGTTALPFVKLGSAASSLLADVTPAADAVPYFPTAGTSGTFTVTAAARALLDDTSSAAMLTTLGAQAADADLAALAAITANGLYVRTGDGTAAARKIAVTGAGLSITNDDGVNGNPTIASNATSANTASAIVARDANGDFAARRITAAGFKASEGAPAAGTLVGYTFADSDTGIFGSGGTVGLVSIYTNNVKTVEVELGAVRVTGDLNVSGYAGALTAAASDNSTTLATTEYVTRAVSDAQATAAINGGSINGTTIGATTASTGKFTTLETTTTAVIGTDLTVQGNLVVNGTTVTMNTSTVDVEDPLMTLGGTGALAVDDNKDRGILFRWKTGTTQKMGFMGYDDSTGKFVLSPDVTVASEVVTATTTGTLVANVEGDLSGNLTAAAPTATTATADTNTTQIATTAFVIGQASSATPAALGTAAIGTSLKYARADHVHAAPNLNALSDVVITSAATGDLLRYNGTNWVNASLATAGIAALASPTFTGSPKAPTQAAGDNSTNLATTAYVDAAVNAGLATNVSITGGSINGTSVGATTASTGKFTTLEATSKLLLPNGTLAAPALAFASDTDTGIYAPGAGQLAIVNDGAAAVTFSSGGDAYFAKHVGIGVAASANANLYMFETFAPDTSRYGVLTTITIDDSAAVTASRSYYGSYSKVNAQTTGAKLGASSTSLFGAYNQIDIAGDTTGATGTLNSVGTYTESKKTAAGPHASLTGLQATSTTNNAGAVVANARGVHSIVANTAGTVTTGYAFHGQFSGTIGTKYGIYVSGSTDNYLGGDMTLTGDLTVSSVLANTQLVARGNATEGGQIVIGHKGNSTAVGQGNSTWNIDVDAQNALRVFSQDASGVSTVALSVAQASGDVSILKNATIIGHLGFGGAGFGSRIVVNIAETYSGDGDAYGISNAVTIDDTAQLTASRNYFGERSTVYSNLSETNRNGQTITLFGAYGRAVRNTGAATNLYGVEGVAEDISALTQGVSAMIGVYGYSKVSGTGAGSVVSFATGARGIVETTTASARIAEARGLYAGITNTAGTIDTGYLVRGTYSGVVTGTKWGIHLVGSTDNRIEGDLTLVGNLTGAAFRASQGVPNSADGSTNGYGFGADGDTGIFSTGSGNVGTDVRVYVNNGLAATFTAAKTTLPAALDVGGNLTVTGNLVVNGSTMTINSTVTTLDDPILTLGGNTAPTVDDAKDRGIEFRWHNGAAAKVGFFGFDDSTGKFTFIPDATNSSEVFSGTKGTLDAYIAWADVTGKPASPVSGAWFSGGFPIVGTDGVMEIGRYLDFHSTNAGVTDLDVRLECTGVGALSLTGSLNVSGGVSSNYFRAVGGAPAGNGSTVGYAFGTDGDTGLFATGNTSTGSATDLRLYHNNVEALRLNTTAGVATTALLYGKGMQIAYTGNDSMYELHKPGVIAYGFAINSQNEAAIMNTNGNGGWNSTLVSWTSGGTMKMSGNIDISSAAFSLGHYDTTVGVTRWLHSNEGNIGFLKSDGNWAAYAANDGGFVVANWLSTGGDLTVNAGRIIRPNAGAVQQVTDTWRYNGVAVWQMGRESDRSFSMWYYDDAGNYAGAFTFNRAGGFTAPGDIQSLSDARLKTDLVVIDRALDKVDRLTGYTYTRKDTGARQAGLMAQEVREVLPEVVHEAEDGTLSVAYGNTVALLVEAIKELRAEVNELRARLA